MDQIYEKLLINNTEEYLNCITNNILGVTNGDNVYFSCIANEIEYVSV